MQTVKKQSMEILILYELVKFASTKFLSEPKQSTSGLRIGLEFTHMMEATALSNDHDQVYAN